MQELIQKLKEQHDLNPEQSKQILNTIKNFIVEKFPMVGGMVDNIFPNDGDTKTDDKSGGGGFGNITDQLGGMFGK